jgi:hypothetical protein
MLRRNALKSVFALAAASIGVARTASAAQPTAPQAGTGHVRVYVEMDVAANREKEMLDAFHKEFVPEAVKHQGYVRVKMLKRRTIIQGTAPATHNYRFELEYENEELRQKWAASPGHQRVWPLIERTITTRTGYPVTLYDEA